MKLPRWILSRIRRLALDVVRGGQEPFEIARSIADLPAPASYDDARLAAAQVRGTEARMDSVGIPAHSGIALAAVLLTAQGSPIDVVDFGGGGGDLFFTIDRIAPSVIRSWSVVETASLSSAARARFGSDRLRYFSDLADVSAPDLVIAQGSLQYTASPLASLRALADLRPTAILISRTPMAEGDIPIYAIQHSRIGPEGLTVGVKSGEPIDLRLVIESRKNYLSAVAEYRLEFEVDGQVHLPLGDGMAERIMYLTRRL